MREKIKEIALGDLPWEAHLIRFSVQVLLLVAVVAFFRFLVG